MGPRAGRWRSVWNGVASAGVAACVAMALCGPSRRRRMEAQQGLSPFVDPLFLVRGLARLAAAMSAALSRAACLAAFSPDYATARRRFRAAAAALGWSLEALPLDGVGPDGTPLTLEAAVSSGGDSTRTLVLSCGLHGVEGYFGSAVQLALLQHWSAMGPPPVRCLFLHALNPFGMAWLRRVDPANVDRNRNFALAGETYRGAPELYRQLDPFLNPRRAPTRVDVSYARAFWLISRHGMAALRQAVAGGQYDFPQGLFYGGSAPSPLQPLLAERLPGWLRGSQEVLHLDLHCGLGAWGCPQLLLESPPSPWQRHWLLRQYGPGSFTTAGGSAIAYDTRGSFGRWCLARQLAPRYLFACAEFGTYGPLRILAGLRAENQAHHWAHPTSAAGARAKRRLQELFAPAAPAWRTAVIRRGMELVERGLRGLEGATGLEASGGG